jgi:hypothetical protein
MKAAQRRLVGYDRQSELEKFEVAIPKHVFGEISSVVSLDHDDPEAIGCYELTKSQAKQIAIMMHKSLPSGLDFFLEGYAP